MASIFGNSGLETQLLSQMWMKDILMEERERLERYQRAWNVYFGKAPDPLKVKEDQPNDNVKINYARLIADTSVGYLFGEEPTFDLDANTKERTTQEQWLDEAWRVNSKMLLLHKAATNGSVCGHVFIKIVDERPYPRLINLSPEYVHVITDPDDIDQVHRYIIQYPATDTDGDRLVIRQTIERMTDNSWEVIDSQARNNGEFVEVGRVHWQYSWPPIVDTQNLPSPNEYYGIADIEGDVLDLNQAINFTLSNLQRIIRFHGHPKTIGKGFKSSELKVNVDGSIVLPNPDADLWNLEMESDLSSSLDYYKRLKEALHETSRTPEIATGKLENTGQFSGVALQILYGSLIQKTKFKQMTYGLMLVELNRRMLELGRQGENLVTMIHWSEIVPKSALEERQVALLDHQLRVSLDTLQQQLGYNPDDERKKKAMEQDELANSMLSEFDRDGGSQDAENDE